MAAKKSTSKKYYMTTRTVTLRKDKKDTAKKVGVIKASTLISASSVVYGKGWSKVSYNKMTGYCKTSYLQLVQSKQNKTSNSKSNQKGSSTNINKLLKDYNMLGVHGMPYQFMTNVDTRVKGTSFGEIYAEDIVADMPLLMITPGEPNFLSGFSKKQKQNILKVLLTSISKTGELTKNAKKAIQDLTASDADDRRYYTFKFNYKSYYEYVNPMLWNCAAYLGIGDRKITIGNQKNKKLCEIDWSKTYNKLKGYTFSQQFISFYLDSENSIQETFSNQTGSSSLADSFNSHSSTANEFRFLTNVGLGKTMGIVDQTTYNAALKELDDLNSKLFNSSKLISNLGKGVLTIASGGKLLFPKIWEDSSYTKSYDISLKLRTPDCDMVSWYLNICVPLMHLIALAAPRQLSGNGYGSPFLIRAWYKGLFNVDMGIIDTLSITKGREAAWTADGLPTEIDINVSITDMYDALFISGLNNNGLIDGVKGTSAKYILKNTGMMDYLASTCGIDVNKVELQRTVEMLSILYKNNLKTIPVRWGQSLQQDLLSYMNSTYRKIYGLK